MRERRQNRGNKRSVHCTNADTEYLKTKLQQWPMRWKMVKVLIIYFKFCKMCGKGIKNKTHSTIRNCGVFSSCFHFSFRTFSRYIWLSCENKNKAKFRKRCVLSWIIKLNSVALVRTRTIPTERPPPVGEVSANFCGYRCHVVSVTGPHSR